MPNEMYITYLHFIRIMNYNKESGKYYGMLNKVVGEFGITTGKKIASFLSQVAEETQSLDPNGEQKELVILS